MKTTKLGNTEVGPGRPPYIIAEVGSNHNGDMELCREMIDAAEALRIGLVQKVVPIADLLPEAMRLACVKSEVVPPLTMFRAIRTQMDELGITPDYRIHALSELPALLATEKS